jgi:phosphoglycolate phosphatase
MTPPSHVLFDLDGTLTDSAPGIVGTLRHALAAEGVEVPAEEVLLQAIGPPFEHGLPDIGVPADLVHAVIFRYRERYEDVGLFENRLYDGIVELLEALAAVGIVLAVATAKPEPTARRIADHFGLSDRFEVLRSWRARRTRDNPVGAPRSRSSPTPSTNSASPVGRRW